MKPTGREVIDVLEKAADLDWFRFAIAETDDVVTHVPVTVWRFGTNEQAEHVISVLSSVLARFSGNVSWLLKNSGGNWVLLPVRVQELEDSGRFRTDGEILDYLLHADPSFGRKAHEDLAKIAGALAKHLSVGS